MTQNPNTPAGGATEYHEKPALNADQPSNLAGAEGPYPAHREGLPAAAREARARGTQPTLGELVARLAELAAAQQPTPRTPLRISPVPSAMRFVSRESEY